MRVNAILASTLAAAGAACSASPLQVVDGGFAGAEAGANADSAESNPGVCTIILASDYDQSCVADEDCVSVGQQPECPIADCRGCTAGGINKSVMTEYMTALSKAIMREPTNAICNCPCETDFALCRGGKCQAAGCGPPPLDTLPACANAGGLCAYRANTTCGGASTLDGCAYSDEMCCLN